VEKDVIQRIENMLLMMREAQQDAIADERRVLAQAARDYMTALHEEHAYWAVPALVRTLAVGYVSLMLLDLAWRFNLLGSERRLALAAAVRRSC